MFEEHNTVAFLSVIVDNAKFVSKATAEQTVAILQDCVNGNKTVFSLLLGQCLYCNFWFLTSQRMDHNGR